MTRTAGSPGMSQPATEVTQRELSLTCPGTAKNLAATAAG